MKHGFYFRFYKLIHNEFICCVLSNLAYFLYCCKYMILKLKAKKTDVNFDVLKATSIINDVYPRPNSKPEYINPTIRDDIDLSVVIPVYNYADMLDKNIKSILNQKTRYKYEVIFVDDGSTDGATDILKKYQDNPKVKLIFQKNAGIGAARNTGINHADGKYLMFIDCDDIVHDNIVELFLNEAYTKNSDIVMASHNLSKERNGEIYQVIPNIYPEKNLVGYKNNDEIMNYAGLPWGKIYKRELWNKVRFFPGYWYEDTIIQFLLFTQCKNFSYIPDVVYEYKWYENNFSHTQGNAANIKTIDSLWLLVEILERYEKLNLPLDNQFYTLLLRHISAYYYPAIKDLDEDIIKAMYVMAADLYKKYKPNKKVKLPFIMREVEKAFDNNDFEIWKLASGYM